MFDAQEDLPGAEAVFADAAAIAADALVHIARRRDGASLLARFGRVLFQPGAKGDVAMGRGVLAISVNASQGLAGRPSSARIVQVVLKGR